MRMILVIAPESYLLGLGEVPSSWPMAALRAQAVAARSYALYKVESGQHRAGCNCGLYDSSLDQVYIGWAKEGGSQGDRWVRAVEQTGGQIVAFSGDVIPAFYTSSDGGHTENNENVWGGTPLPYLRGVCDPGDYTSANPSAVWKVSYSAGSVTNRLAGYTGNIGTVSGFTDFDRGVSGRIITVRVEGNNGSDVISGAQFRAGLGLKDDRVWVNRNRNVTGRIRATYDAASCAPGLPTSPEVDVSGTPRRDPISSVAAAFRCSGESSAMTSRICTVPPAIRSTIPERQSAPVSWCVQSGLCGPAEKQRRSSPVRRMNAKGARRAVAARPTIRSMAAASGP